MTKTGFYGTIYQVDKLYVKGCGFTRKYINIAVVSFFVVCCVLFCINNGGYWLYRYGYASLTQTSDYNFRGELKVTVSTEDFGYVDMPYTFSGTVCDIAQQSMEFSMDAVSVVDGIQSTISKYFVDGVTYTETRTEFDGMYLGTEKIRGHKYDMEIFPQSSVFEYIDIEPLVRKDFAQDRVTYSKKSKAYIVDVTGEQLRNSLYGVAYKLLHTDSRFTKSEIDVKLTKYSELLFEYFLEDIDISYALCKSGEIRLDIKASVLVPESPGYPNDRDYDISLELYIDPLDKGTKTAIIPPDDLHEYVFSVRE